MTRYAFLGPAGTFSEEALYTLGIEDLEPVECTSIPEVFEAVERGRADAGVVPIENSIEGSVPATLDALAFDTQLEIQSELVLDIHFCVVVAPGVKLADVTSVVAHPQASGQCRRWLERYLPGRAGRSPPTPTPRRCRRRSPRRVSRRSAPPSPRSSTAARSLESRVEDYAGNQTRFVVIGRGLRERTGKDKTSLALFMKKDKPGALLMILSEFAYGDINLTKIQSRPTKRQLGDYMFFVDLEGHVDDGHVKTALDCLRMKLRDVKVLGSYPRV